MREVPRVVSGIATVNDRRSRRRLLRSAASGALGLAALLGLAACGGEEEGAGGEIEEGGEEVEEGVENAGDEVQQEAED